MAECEVSPPDLLDDYLAAAGGTGALAATAARTGSLSARALLARAAAGPTAGLDELLAAARAGDRGWFARRRRQVNPVALGDLARVLALQDVRPGDRADALALLDMLLTAFGAFRVPRSHQGLHAQLAYVAGDGRRAAALLRAYPLMPVPVRVGLRLDLTNPAAGGPNPQRWWRSFTRLLPGAGLTLGPDDTGPPFDRVTGNVARPAHGPVISVIVTAYRPDRALLTAVRSLLDQSWRNVEVIVVDDASPAQHTAVLDACVGLDPRVRLIRLPTNGGTYVARNVGLDAVTGDFVTFQDSDDWSHPRRLERQVRPLLGGAGPVATISDGIPVTDELLVTRLGHTAYGRLNPSSLMFRRLPVRERLGYFDSVRKGADSEMIDRIRAAYGERAVRHLGPEPYALIRLSPGSLSRGEVRAGWLHPARAAYMSAYRTWHAGIATGLADPYRHRSAAPRPFAAPAHIRASGRPPTQEYDVVYVTDWTASGGPQRAALDDITALTAHGMRVAVTHLESFRTSESRRRPLQRRVQALVNDSMVDHLPLSAEAETALVVVRQPSVLQFAGGRSSGLRARRLVVLADEAPTRRDGMDRRYTPAHCGQAARELFGAEPVWCPQDGSVRAALRASGGADLTPYDLPGGINVDPCAGRRAAFRGEQPVIGADLADDGTDFSAAGAALRAYLMSVDADVRFRRAHGYRITGHSRRWLVYEADDVPGGDFAEQLDIYLHFPHPERAELLSRPVLEAFAAGCVVVMPPRLAAWYGDAAVGCEIADLPAVLARYGTDLPVFLAQSERARTAARDGYRLDALVARVKALVELETRPVG